MKNKLVITLLALTMTTAMLAGCGKKETAEVQTADTEAVAEVNTETKAVVAETETEESTEGAELVYNTETDTELVAKGDKTKPDKADAKTDSTGSTKDSVSKTETKADSTKNDSATQAPAETPAETPEPAPAQNLCPYTLNQWLDLGDGWWGYYTCFQSPEGTVSALNKEFTDVIVTPDATWTYDDWGGELVGNYDDAKDVILTKFHMVPITN